MMASFQERFVLWFASILLVVVLHNPRQAAAQAQCELWLELSYSSGNDSLTPKVHSQPVCIKYEGQPLRIPQAHTLFLAASTNLTRFRYFCREKMPISLYDVSEGRNIDDRQRKQVEQLNNFRSLEAKSRVDYSYVCEWNNLFHHAYPFTFHIYTGVGNRQISSNIRLIRFYRNGALAYTWNVSGNQQLEADLWIPGEGLTAPRLPHRSDFDLRIVPQGIEIKEDLIREKVTVQSSKIQSELSRIAQASLWAVQDPQHRSKLNNFYECFMGHVRVLVQASGELSSAERHDRSEVSLTTKSSCSTISGFPIESDGSQTPKALATFFNKKKALLKSSSLPKLIDKLRSGELKNTDELRNKFRATVSELGIVADQDIEPAVSQIISALRMAANGISGIDKVRVEQDVATMQRVFSEARDLLHDTREFGDLIAKDALRSLGDPSEQARMWARFAEGLDSNSTFFEARGRNPQFLAGEEALQMEYGDPHQFYVLAPWHMLALRWGESPGTTFGVENLVPAIDVVGYRYQWARSRFADLRFGLGGVFIKDRLSVPDPTQPGQRFDKDFYNFAAQFNMGLGGFKLGLGYLLSNNGEAALPWDATRIRILVGADLVKLFSGRNAEAL